METSLYLQNAINSIPELQILGQPHVSVISFGSSSLNIYSIADVMEKSGYKMERQQNPACIHMTLMPPHSLIKEDLVEKLKNAVAYVKQHPGISNQNMLRDFY